MTKPPNPEVSLSGSGTENDIHPEGMDQNVMTLRDWFAGLVLPSFAESHSPKHAADECYRYADAMLIERQKPPENSSH